MGKTDIIWVSYHDDVLARGYWDDGLLEDTFAKVGNFEHHIGFKDIKGDSGGVVVINGRTHTEPEDIAKLNNDLQLLDWCLLIVTGDEESLFPWREVKHHLMRVWIMLPKLNQHDDVSFHLPNGYRPETRDMLREIGRQPRTQDWFFAGQVNHERREQCVQEIEYLIKSGENQNGTMVVTDGFGKEVLNYKDYMRHMANSKVVFCPSGVESPDNFRLYEALEAGCIPIVDAFSTKHKHPGFWRLLFGDDIPFPIVEYWDELPALLPELLKGWPHNANKIFSWWQNKRREIRFKLIDDIKELSK